MHLKGKYIVLGILPLVLALLNSTALFSQPLKSFTLKISGYRGAIQWEQSNDRNIWTNVTNGNVDSLTVHADKTTYYRAKITEPNCPPAYSDIKAVFQNGGDLIGAKFISGKVVLPEGSPFEKEKLKARSLIGQSNVTMEGDFQLLVSDSTSEEILIVVDNNDEVVMIGYYIGSPQSYIINAESTAMAVVIMYPFLKPISISRKDSLIKEYKAQQEFSQLAGLVEGNLKNGKNTISSFDNQARDLIIQLISKSYNDDRLKPLRKENGLLANDEIKISSQFSTVTLENTTAFSYFGSIYRKKDNFEVSSFILPGELLSTSDIVQKAITIFKPINTPTPLFKPTAEFDLRQLGENPGEYELILRSGAYLDLDRSIESINARKQNWYEGATTIIYNIPLIIPMIPEGCWKEIIEGSFDIVKDIVDFTPKKNLAGEVIFPALITALETTAKCAGELPEGFIKKIYRIAKIIYETDKEWPSVSFFPTWLTKAYKVDICQFLGSDFKALSCFRIIKDGEIPDKTSECSTITLKLKTVQNNDYYPYVAKPIPNINFEWSAINGKFYPSGATKVASKTDEAGMDKIQWTVSSSAGSNSAFASVEIEGAPQTLEIFNTNVLKYTPKVKMDGVDQIGQINEPLPKFISFSIQDQNLGNFLYLNDNYTVEYKINGEGSLNSKQGIDLSVVTNEWVLGPLIGEQSVEILIIKKSCEGQSSGEPMASITFKAIARSLPILTTINLSSITSTTARSGGNITNDGGSPITAKGVCWSTSPNPTSDLTTRTNDGTGISAYTSNITSLEPGTKYYVRAFATNDGGTAYGNEVPFTTKVESIPNVITTAIASITQTSAISGGTITDDGGSPITSKGICWSRSPNPTIDLTTKTMDGTGTNDYTSSITGLEAGRKYFVRAYATNDKGTVYGNEVSFTSTSPTPPNLVGVNYSLIKYKFGASIPGYYNYSTRSDPHYEWIGKWILSFESPDKATVYQYDSTGTHVINFSTSDYTLRDYFPDTTFIPSPCSPPDECSGNQYPEGWGTKLPPGFEIKFAGSPAFLKTRVSADGKFVYSSDDAVYQKL